MKRVVENHRNADLIEIAQQLRVVQLLMASENVQVCMVIF